MISAVLARTESPPFGIQSTNKTWKLITLKEGVDQCLFNEMLFDKLNSLCEVEIKNESRFPQLERGWDNLISPYTASFIKKHHPNLQFEDISSQLGLALFTHIIARNLNDDNWYGGVPGSVHFDYHEAKKRTISEVLERTYLSKKKTKIWSSAIAYTAELALAYAKNEALERLFALRYWQNIESYREVPLLESSLLKAVAFEWKKYDANITYISFNSQFDINVAIAKVVIYLNNQQWIFYGNGYGTSELIAVQKACMETLQFIPGWEKQFYEALNNSKDPSAQRVLKWSKNCKEDFPSSLPIDIVELFLHLNFQVEEFPECPGIFIAYSNSSQINWRELSGIPIA